jgi:cardiolipin synthase A/B
MKPVESAVRAGVIVEPDDGLEPVLGFIASAKHTLIVKQFEASEPTLLQALSECKKRGVAVRVMLNPGRASGQRDNDATFEALKAASIKVAWTAPKFMVTHEKSMVADGERALVSTFNLSAKYFSATRDYGIITHDAAQVADVAACFEADWNREPFAPAAETGLLWSDDNARAVMAAFIDGAVQTLDVQNPKFMDSTILDRVLMARDRGVRIRVVFGGRHGTTQGDVVDTFSSLRVLQRAGVKVHRQKLPKLHAKLMVADGDRALVGSQNIDRVAFDFRRELGLVVTAPGAVKRLWGTFLEDWQAAKPYEVPDPMAPMAHDPEEHPPDPGFQHE